MLKEDSNGNAKGTFQEFQFASTGASAPYNEGHGQNLLVYRETRGFPYGTENRTR